MTSIVRIILAAALSALLTACGTERATGPAMIVSVSPNGHWAVSSHRDGTIVLWNIAQRSARVVSNNANIYSAYFVADNRHFLWQGQDGVVHVDKVAGGEQNSFKNFPVYGQAMGKHGQLYLAVSQDYGVYAGHGATKKQVKAPGGSFLGYGKLLNLSLSPDNKRFTTSGFGSPYDAEWESIAEEKRKGYKDLVGVTLWSAKTLRPTAKLPGNAAKTFATFSPDGKYILSGDEDLTGIVWKTHPPRQTMKLASLFHGVYIGQGKDLDGLYGTAFAKAAYDKTGLIKPPRDFHGEAILSLRFIDKRDHYLRFTTYSPYAILYKIDSPLPIKYLPLGKHPFPAVSDYSRNTAIDTAPAAGILAMGERNGNGIIVYHYDDKTETLKKVWVSD